MRDPERIKRVCSRLSAAWSATPDMRFGQLMFNVFRQIEADGKDPFYVEDVELARYVERFCFGSDVTLVNN